MQTICTINGVTAKRTGRDYDFIATLENDNDEAVEIAFTDDFEDTPEPFIIHPHGWIGVTGWNTLDALENKCFEIRASGEY